MNLEQFSLKNKTILITGASGGIGKQTAITISEAGAKVIVTGRNEENLLKTYHALIGNNHQYIVADLCNEEDGINKLTAQLPKLDGIVHAAGIVDLFPTKFINKKKINITFDINFVAPVLLMTSIFRNKLINNNCSVVFISSHAAIYPYISGALYAASKAALENYSKVLAGEHSNINLRSNAIAPAIIKTDMFEKAKNLAQSLDKDVEANERKYLLGYGDTQDVANLILFLLSDASKWITGQTIPLDGGYLIGLISNK